MDVDADRCQLGVSSFGLGAQRDHRRPTRTRTAQSNASIAFPISGASSSTPTRRPRAVAPDRRCMLTLTSLSADRPAPQPAGSAITFTATATGGASPYQVQVVDLRRCELDRRRGGRRAITGRGHQARPTPRLESACGCAMPAATLTRTTTRVRTAASHTRCQPLAESAPSTPLAPPSTPSGGVLTLTSIGADRVAPQPVGTPVTFTALAVGGAAPVSGQVVDSTTAPTGSCAAIGQPATPGRGR